jgi:hypothetical protein
MNIKRFLAKPWPSRLQPRVGQPIIKPYPSGVVAGN